MCRTYLIEHHWEKSNLHMGILWKVYMFEMKFHATIEKRCDSVEKRSLVKWEVCVAIHIDTYKKNKIKIFTLKEKKMDPEKISTTTNPSSTNQDTSTIISTILTSFTQSNEDETTSSQSLDIFKSHLRFSILDYSVFSIMLALSGNFFLLIFSPSLSRFSLSSFSYLCCWASILSLLLLCSCSGVCLEKKMLRKKILQQFFFSLKKN